jgi:ornithine--oxo-acid transaminase
VIRELLEQDAGREFDLYAQTINPQFVRLLRTIGFDRVWARAEGAYLYDKEGRKYLDMLGGFGMYNVGRNNPRVRAALADVLELNTAGKTALGIGSLWGLLARELLHRAPSSVDRVLFTSSGTESVEAAIKLGRAATGRSRVVSCELGYHGATLGSLSASGQVGNKEKFGPLLPGFSQIPFGDLAALERELSREDVALFVVEPVQGHGAHFPPEGYLQGAQALCGRYGTLFCVDEIQTGLGRTGRLFALEHWGLEPDLIPLAKSLSGGYVPSGALLFSAAVYDAVFDSFEAAFPYGSTYAPNDLAMAAGLATLRELDGQGLVERSAKLGEFLLEQTRPLVERYDVVKEVRGLGLMWAIEFAEPPGGSRSWRMLERMQGGLFSQLVVLPLFSDHAILSQVAGRDMNVIKILPPLTLSEEDVNWFCEALESTVARAERMPWTMMAGLAVKAARARRPLRSQRLSRSR